MICRGAVLLMLAAAVAGCSVRNAAPVQERVVNKPAAPPRARVPEPSADSHTVRSGDTLYAIALDHGLDYRDLARFNGIDNPDLIRVGQVLRLRAPDAQKPPQRMPVAVASPRADSKVEEAAPLTPVAAPEDEDEPAWRWPSRGRVLATFGPENKGVDIAGERGQPVAAAAAGRVVYAGGGLRGYGKLVIIKHNAAFLTAYAHNQEILVREGQTVGIGQKVAEMGDTDATAVKLHFEIRRFGTPVDPLKHLPAPP